jgi:hypothetical protein
MCQSRLAKLYGEAIPMDELVKLSLRNGKLDGLFLVEIRRLVLRIPRLAAVFEVLVPVVVVSALGDVVDFSLILIPNDVLVGVVVGEFPLEEPTSPRYLDRRRASNSLVPNVIQSKDLRT